jgi:hypothetical protein
VVRPVSPKVGTGDFAFPAGHLRIAIKPRGWYLEFRRGLLARSGVVRRLRRRATQTSWRPPCRCPSLPASTVRFFRCAG